MAHTLRVKTLFVSLADIFLGPLLVLAAAQHTQSMVYLFSDGSAVAGANSKLVTAGLFF